MPTYKNLGNKTEVIHSISFHPRKEIKVNFYVDNTNYPDIKLIDEEPEVNPIIYSEQLSSGTFDVFEHITDEACAIRLAASEPSLISFNKENAPKMLITQLSVETLRNIEQINKIFIHSGNVSIEIWKAYNWRFFEEK